VWAVCAYLFLVPKTYTEDIRTKIKLENKFCMGHNAKKINAKFIVFLLEIILANQQG
jgi:hypothetical protein